MNHWIKLFSTGLLLSGLITACSESTQQKTEALESSKGDSSALSATASDSLSSAQKVAGVTFLEEVKAKPGEVVIPYKKYKLDNGLTVILHEDHSDPLVHVDITYHVGSAREEPGKSGFAHFFEHMMFQGSENVADELHIKLITEAGGTMNGTTNSDRTNYFQTVPANQLEKILWLEADRMGFLVDAVTQKKFEVQRETVKNERGERVDNRPYGRLRERVAEALYPVGHPYSWPVIGFMEDLNRVNVNDLKAFFLRWYGPNNATVTIGGDINEAEALKQVVRYFASIPAGPEVKMPEKLLVTLDADRYLSMQDNVQLPLVYLSLPTVYVRHEDEAPLDVLAEILGGGKTSILYKNLVKTQYAVHAAVHHPCAELACTFNFQAYLNPASGKSLADLESIMRAALGEFEQRGIQQDDLDKVKAKMESIFVFGLQSVAGKVSQLAANQTFTANPNYIKTDIARYSNVTKADVERVYKRYIKDKPAVIMSIVPDGQEKMIAAKDNFNVPERKLVKSQPASADELKLRKARDTFDRSKIPVAGKSRSIKLPTMWSSDFTNGIKVSGTQSLETPTTSVLFKIAAGHYYESKDKAGTAALLAKMLNESTTQRSAEEMTMALEKLGSTVNIRAEDHYLIVNINSLTRNLEQTITLVNEKLMNPAFDKSDFSRIKHNTIQQIKNKKKDAEYLASTAFRQLMHGDNIAATPVEGSEKSVSSIDLSEVKSFYQKQMKPHNAHLLLISDLSQKDLVNKISVFSTWKGKGPALNLLIGESKARTAGIYLVHKDNAAQSAIRIGKRSLPKDFTGEFYKNNLMNFPLGGAFNSRINLNLREEKGYTYGARSYFGGDKLSGQFTAGAEVRANVTDKSIIEFTNEINAYQSKGITQEELSFLRQSVIQRDALKYETPRAKLNFFAQILEYDLTPDFVKQRAEIAKHISMEEINKLAKKHLKLKEMLIVVVGDSKALKPQLQALGYKVENYDIK